MIYRVFQNFLHLTLPVAAPVPLTSPVPTEFNHIMSSPFSNKATCQFLSSAKASLPPNQGWTRSVWLEVHPCTSEGMPDLSATHLLDVTSTITGLPFRRGRNPLASYLRGCHWLAASLPGPDHKDGSRQLQDHIIRVAQLSLVGLRFADSSRLQTGLYCISFGCILGRKHRPMANRSSDAITTTKLPKSDEQVCRFRFSVYWSPKHSRWFLPSKQQGCLSHSGLPHQYETPGQVPVHIRLSEKEMNEIMTELEVDTPVSTIIRQHHARSGILLDSKQIESIRRYHSKLVIGDASTPASRLYHFLTTSPNMFHCILTAEKDAGTKKITIYAEQYTSKGKKKPSLMARNKVQFDDGSPDDVAQQVFDSLSLEAGGKVMLCAAWVEREAWDYFTAFPETVAFDTTRKTNAERRPLFIGTTRTARSRLVPFFSCFMPSECSWVFHWIVHEAFPQIFRKETLHRVRLVLTDHDDKCYQQVESAIACGILPNAVHRSCAWHKINRNWEKDIYHSVSKDPEQNLLDRAFIAECVDWFWTFPQMIETEEEEQHQIRSFQSYLSAKKETVSSKVFDTTETFFTTYFVRDLKKICQRHYIDVPGSDTTTSTWAEIEFSSLVRSRGGPKTGMGIDRSAQSILTCHSFRVKRVRQECMRDLHTQHTSSLTRSQQKVSDGDQNETAQAHAYRVDAYGGLRAHLVRPKAHLLEKQWYQLMNYYFTEMNVATMECPSSVKRVFLVRQFNKLNQENDEVIRDYHRTRMVRLVSAGPHDVFCCDCGMFQRTGVCCRHIFSITLDNPTPDHCAARCFKTFEAHYGKDDTARGFHDLCDLQTTAVRCFQDIPNLETHSQFLDHSRLDWFLEPLTQPLPVVGAEACILNVRATQPLTLPPPESGSSTKLPSYHTPSPKKVKVPKRDNNAKWIQETECYHQTYQLFATCVKYATTQEDIDRIKSALEPVKGALLQKHQQRPASTNELQSFPHFERQGSTRETRMSSSPGGLGWKRKRQTETPNSTAKQLF